MLPITNVRLQACHENWQQMTPTAQGRHCAACNREVIDFTQATTADLHRARAAAPGGRLCGRFRLSQLAHGRPGRFGLWARAFVLVAALVFGQGLTAREAWAQAKRAGKHPVPKAATRAEPSMPDELLGEALPDPEPPVKAPIYQYAERMPEPPGGQEGYRQAMRKELRRPAGEPLEGKVFVQFVVQPDGHLTDLKVLRGLSPAYDAEALRVVQRLQPWTPGQYNGRAVPVSFTQVVTFGAPK
jgi:protein TonB